MRAAVDYDLHGLVRVRLLDATADDAVVVRRQLGPIEAAPAGESDISIRFVDRLPTAAPVRFLGLGEVCFTDDSFLVLRSRHKSYAKVQIPFDRISRGCEIVCERGLSQVPLLIPIINLTVLGKGSLPLHAAAFNYNGRGIVTTGWSKGGKTEALLGFMANGATYIGDEWIYFSEDGRRMYGIPEPIRVGEWHLDHQPQYRAAVRRTDRARLKLLKVVVNGMGRITANGARHRSFSARTMNRIAQPLRNQLCVDIPPEVLFGEDACSMAGTPDKIFFVTTHESPEVTVRPMDPQEIARRMVFSLQEEQMNFMSYYWKFRFAFPEAENDLIERSRQMQEDLLGRCLRGREAYVVCHPYPVPIPALFEAMRPYCD